MTKGKHLSHEMRTLVFHLLIELDLPSDQVYVIINTNNGEILSMDYLIRLKRRLNSSVEFSVWFQSEPKKHSGKKRLLSDLESSTAIAYSLGEKCKSIGKMRTDFINMYYEDQQCPHLSESTLLRTFHREKISRKVMSRKHYLCNDLDGAYFFERLSHINPINLIDIDETASSPESFLQKHGWSPEGEECKKVQFVIGSKSYSSIAALSPLGIIAWAIYDCTITHIEFNHFLSERLQPRIARESVVIIDNARTHKTQESRTLMENIFDGNYYFSPPYSPHLKPIEKCFSLIKRFVRENEDEALINPISFLDYTFSLYSVGGEKAHAVYNFFNFYFQNHELMLARNKA
jgi:transposase